MKRKYRYLYFLQDLGDLIFRGSSCILDRRSQSRSRRKASSRNIAAWKWALKFYKFYDFSRRSESRMFLNIFLGLPGNLQLVLYAAGTLSRSVRTNIVVIYINLFCRVNLDSGSEIFQISSRSKEFASESFKTDLVFPSFRFILTISRQRSLHAASFPAFSFKNMRSFQTRYSIDGIGWKW